MSGEERRQILHMLETGSITADQALALINELEQDSQSEDAAAAAAGTVGTSDAGLDSVAARARELWQIPLWIGVGITVLSALGMYSSMQGGSYGFWFYCLWAPFLLGVALTALAVWSRTARWLFVNVERPRGADWPRHILLGFPLPLELAGWFLRTFGRYIDGLQRTSVDEVVQAISTAQDVGGPLIVNVEEGGNGEHVQVFIG